MTTSAWAFILGPPGSSDPRIIYRHRAAGGQEQGVAVGRRRQAGRRLPRRRLCAEHGTLRGDPQSARPVFQAAIAGLDHGRSEQDDVTRLSDRDQRQDRKSVV